VEFDAEYMLARELCILPPRHRSLLLMKQICCISIGFILTVFTVATIAHAAAPRQPNILLILADDIGYSDYGCYGGEIRTPNIDRRAGEGLRFTQFYNNAVCVPTRYSLLTGLYPRYVGSQHRIGLS